MFSPNNSFEKTKCDSYYLKQNTRKLLGAAGDLLKEQLGKHGKNSEKKEKRIDDSFIRKGADFEKLQNDFITYIKAFRDLFGKVDDVRTSIYEGMNRLSVIARKNEMYENILNADLIAKSKVTAETPFGKRGFFHDSELDAQAAFGTNVKIVPLNKYIKSEVNKIYQCPMHPNEKSNQPGKCKLCKMEMKGKIG